MAVSETREPNPISLYVLQPSARQDMHVSNFHKAGKLASRYSMAKFCLDETTCTRAAMYIYASYRAFWSIISPSELVSDMQ